MARLDLASNMLNCRCRVGGGTLDAQAPCRPVLLEEPVLPLHFEPAEFHGRLDRTLAAMAERGLDGLLMFKQESISQR